MLTKIIDFIRRNFWVHSWSYHNRYDRRCEICGRHEVKHAFVDEYCGNGIVKLSKDWWEIFDEGIKEKHKW